MRESSLSAAASIGTIGRFRNGPPLVGVVGSASAPRLRLFHSPAKRMTPFTIKNAAAATGFAEENSKLVLEGDADRPDRNGCDHD